jgi:hypothetical protein
MTVLTPPQIADRWKCKPETVRRLLESGLLHGFTLSPPGTRRARWRVTLDSVLAYEAGDAQSQIVSDRPRRRSRRAATPAGPF